VLVARQCLVRLERLVEARLGRQYTVTQWYPKIAVYDERGWVCDPYYYTSEFYGDFGAFDVAVTLPDRMWVDGTGECVGAEGGDNEIPLFDADTPRDSVTVGLGPHTPIRSLEPGVPPPAGPAWQNFLIRFEAAYRAEFAEFLRVARGEAPSPCTGRDGLEALRVAEAATRSLQEHRPVRVAEIVS